MSGFPRAFGMNGWVWAEKLTAIGEIIVLPLVVLMSIQAQTRLLFAMSKDGILPKLFGKFTFAKKRKSPCCGKEGKEDTIGNLTQNVQVCGVVLVILAIFVPFQYLDSLVSAGALLLFSLTDCCLLMIRYKCPSESFLGSLTVLDENASIITVATVSIRRELSLSRILILLNVFPFISGLCFAFIPIHLAALRWTLTVLFALLTLAVTTYIAICCNEITST